MADWSKPVDVWIGPAICLVEFHVDRARHAGRVSRDHLRAGRVGLHGAGWLLGGLLHGHVSVHVSVSDRLRVDGLVTGERRWF